MLGFRCFSVLEVGLFVCLFVVCLKWIQKEISRWRGLR